MYTEKPTRDGYTIAFGMILWRASMKAIAGMSAKKAPTMIATQMSRYATNATAKSEAVRASAQRIQNRIRKLQSRQRPRRRSHETIGMLSCTRISLPH